MQVKLTVYSCGHQHPLGSTLLPMVLSVPKANPKAEVSMSQAFKRSIRMPSWQFVVLAHAAHSVTLSRMQRPYEGRQGVARQSAHL
jgi:hypothetical protein